MNIINDDQVVRLMCQAAIQNRRFHACRGCRHRILHEMDESDCNCVTWPCEDLDQHIPFKCVEVLV